MPLHTKRPFTYPLWIYLSCSLLFLVVLSLAQLAIPTLSENSGWPYFLVVIVILFTLYLASSKNLLNQLKTNFEVQRPSKKMLLYMISCLFLCQTLFSFSDALVEGLLNLIGHSATEQIEAASGSSTTWSMFFYTICLAPLCEELLFRGFLYQSFLKCGKNFAIFFSALLFGLYHANIVQTPFAFVLGIVLGYITAIYGLKYAIFLHVFNNLVLGEIFDLCLQHFPQVSGPLLEVTHFSFVLIALYFLYHYRIKIKSFYQRAPFSKKVWRQATFNLPFCLILVTTFGLMFLTLN